MLRPIGVAVTALISLPVASTSQPSFGADVSWSGWGGPGRDGSVSGFRPSALTAEPARSSKDSQAQPVVVATGTYVRSAKYDSNWAAPNSSGLGSATSCIAYQRAKAVRFVGQHDRTYLVLGDSACHPVIVYFDHRSRQWSKPVRFGVTEVKDDAHGLPAIAVDEQGFIHALYGAHGTKMYATRSSRPEAIDAWTPPTLASTGGTYSTVFFVKETLYLFLREQGARWGFKTSRDGGRTWSDMRVVCRAFSAPAGVFYPVVWIGEERPAPRLHMFWMFYYRRKTWEDMYYAFSDDLGKTWRKASGELIGEEISYGQGDLVYRGDTHGWQHQVTIDPSGRPGLLFGTGGLPVVKKNDLLFAYWTGQEWGTSRICPLASRYCSGAKGRVGKVYAWGEAGTLPAQPDPVIRN
jgi:hypothetical protein